jgi:hypothetical protein
LATLCLHLPGERFVTGQDGNRAAFCPPLFTYEQSDQALPGTSWKFDS